MKLHELSKKEVNSVRGGAVSMIVKPIETKMGMIAIDQINFTAAIRMAMSEICTKDYEAARKEIRDTAMEEMLQTTQV